MNIRLAPEYERYIKYRSLYFSETYSSYITRLLHNELIDLGFWNVKDFLSQYEKNILKKETKTCKNKKTKKAVAGKK